MCFSLPVIVSNIVGSAADLVKPNENGYIFPCGEISKLIDFLEDLIQHPDRRKVFGKKSLKIIQGYSYEKDIEGILLALNSISLFK